MDQNARAVMEKRMAIVCSNLEKNNMQAFYVPSGEEALQLVQSMLREGMGRRHRRFHVPQRVRDYRFAQKRKIYLLRPV